MKQTHFKNGGASKVNAHSAQGISGISTDTGASITIGTGANSVTLVQKNMHGAIIFAEPDVRDNPEPLESQARWWHFWPARPR